MLSREQVQGRLVRWVPRIELTKELMGAFADGSAW
jgi:hypothetical protein